jgi:uncharacterized NAD(P)/FAD-binding protein YdhS
MIEVDVAIVGGGFSGCAVAANLARRAGSQLAIALFEPGELGLGAAYGTRHREHLLNTRAHLMGIYADDPDHFVRWLGLRGGPLDFMPRQLYGEYVAEIARQTFTRPRFTHVRDRVRRAYARDDGGFIVDASLGARFGARAVVLATGNPAPREDFLPAGIRLHPGFIADPWRFDYRIVGGHVLVIGTGLTALDVLVALDASGHRGTVHMLSRNCRFSAVHANVAPYDVIPALDTHDARTLLRSFRHHLDEASRRGFDWRAVIDALRPESEAIWRRLSPVEQRRFERHLRSRWERHRHRAPASVDGVRQAYARDERLFTYSGHLAGAHAGGVTIAARSGAIVTLRPDWIVNCSGVGPEPALLGFRARPDLAALDGNGDPVPGMWIVGPPAREARFEATAVPEVRGMAELAAFSILRELGPEVGVGAGAQSGRRASGASWAF